VNHEDFKMVDGAMNVHGPDGVDRRIRNQIIELRYRLLSMLVCCINNIIAEKTWKFYSGMNLVTAANLIQFPVYYTGIQDEKIQL